MKFESGRLALDKVLGLASKALPSKDYGDATSGIMLEIPEENPKELIVTCNSLELFIRSRIKLNEAGEPGVVVPSGKILVSIVSSLKSMKHPIVVDYNDEVCNISCGKEYSGSVAHYDTMGFLVPTSDEDIKALPTMSVPLRLIKKAVNEVTFSCGTDKTHLYLTGVFFDQSKDSMNIVGSDAMRISICRYNSKIKDPHSVVFPKNILDLISKVSSTLEIDDNKIITFYVSDDDNMAYMIVDDTTIGFQTYGKTFIGEEDGGYQSFIIDPEDCAVRLRVDREAFLSRLELAVSHNSSNNDTVLFCLESKKKGSLKSKVESSSGNVNTFDIPFDIDKIFTGKNYKLKKFKIGVNPQFLFDVLTRLKYKDVDISLVDVENGPVVIYTNSENGVSGDYIHVFSLV